MVSAAAARRTNYERLFQAIGRLAEKQRLRDICVLEIAGGVVVQGRAMVSTRDGYQLVANTRVLDHDDLDKLMREL